MTNPNAADIKAKVGAILGAAENLKAACAENAPQLVSENAPESADAVNQLAADMEAARARLVTIFRALSDLES